MKRWCTGLVIQQPSTQSLVSVELEEDQDLDDSPGNTILREDQRGQKLQDNLLLKVLKGSERHQNAMHDII